MPPTSGKHACIYAHGSTTWQQSRSHSNAICNRRLHKTVTPHTPQDHLPSTTPLQHSCIHCNAICTTKWQTRVYLKSTRIARQHCNNHAAIPMRSATSVNADATRPWNYARRNKPKTLLNFRAMGEPEKHQNDGSHTCVTNPIAVIASGSHFTRENNVWRSGILPSPMQQSRSHSNTSIRQNLPKSTHFTKPPLLLAAISPSHRFAGSPLPQVITSPSHHCPKPSLPHYLSRSPLP